MVQMFLVVDANELFSFFKKDSERRKLIRELPEYKYELVSPDFAFTELINEKGKILKYSMINELQFKLLLAVLEYKIKTIPKSEYEAFTQAARELAPHTKDIPYFALALFLNCPIWSDEKAFKQQSKVKVYSTKEVLELLR